jgi:predicted nuclease of restriction endonuclease-like (RecB) superfamily
MLKCVYIIKQKTMDSTPEYSAFFKEIKSRIRSAQYEALRAVNKELVGLYWDMGRLIAQKQQELGWGRSVVETLASDLQREFPGQRGFSVRNLWQMVQLYTEYQHDTFLQSLTAEISFSHNMIIITKCGNVLELKFFT